MSQKPDLDELIPELERLEEELLETTDRLETILAFVAARARIENDLLAAKQSLTDEMARLLGSGFQRRNNTIGGITVDSEYIIFVIDTSGSMQQGAWSGGRRQGRGSAEHLSECKRHSSHERHG